MVTFQVKVWVRSLTPECIIAIGRSVASGVEELGLLLTGLAFACDS